MSNERANWVPVICPVCKSAHGVDHTGAFSCSCGQPLSPDEHLAPKMTAYFQHVEKRVTAQRIRGFLLDLANVAVPQADHRGFDRIARRFPEFFPPSFPNDTMAKREMLAALRDRPISPGELSAAVDAAVYGDLHEIRQLLGLTWSASEQAEREWRSVPMRRAAWELVTHPSTRQAALSGYMQVHTPPRTAFEQALLYLQEKRRMAKLCANPGCNITRYFFAENPRDSYCSETCKKQSKQERDRAYWDVAGKQKRIERIGR